MTTRTRHEGFTRCASPVELTPAWLIENLPEPHIRPGPGWLRCAQGPHPHGEHHLAYLGPADSEGHWARWATDTAPFVVRMRACQAPRGPRTCWLGTEHITPHTWDMPPAPHPDRPAICQGAFPARTGSLPWQWVSALGPSLSTPQCALTPGHGIVHAAGAHRPGDFTPQFWYTWGTRASEDVIPHSPCPANPLCLLYTRHPGDCVVRYARAGHMVVPG